VVVAGDSAGGGLAVAAATSLRDRGARLPDLVVCLSPWVDLAGSGGSRIANARLDPVLPAGQLPRYARAYLAGTDPRNPLVSPVHADLRGLPPLFIQAGGDEVLLDDARRLHAAARAAGVDATLAVWPGMWHGFQAFADIMPEGRRAVDEVGAFVRGRLAG
jgi:acetyl esterase/lipase